MPPDWFRHPIERIEELECAVARLQRIVFYFIVGEIVTAVAFWLYWG